MRVRVRFLRAGTENKKHAHLSYADCLNFHAYSSPYKPLSFPSFSRLVP